MTRHATPPGPPPAVSAAQVLLIDADDTLWENNILFERVIDAYLDWLTPPGLSRAQVRTELNAIEHANAVALGYGSQVFLLSLAQCAAKLTGLPTTDADREHIELLAAPLLRRGGIELIPGVADTLTALGARHELRLVTKGDLDEQTAKVAASGIGDHFRSVHVVPEKNTATYLALIAELGLDPATGWMIGNSPKSDILPAREAGLRAVFIPHEHTWVLEHDVVDPADSGILQLASFAELLHHF